MYITKKQIFLTIEDFLFFQPTYKFVSLNIDPSSILFRYKFLNSFLKDKDYHIFLNIKELKENKNKFKQILRKNYFTYKFRGVKIYKKDSEFEIKLLLILKTKIEQDAYLVNVIFKDNQIDQIKIDQIPSKESIIRILSNQIKYFISYTDFEILLDYKNFFIKDLYKYSIYYYQISLDLFFKLDDYTKLKYYKNLTSENKIIRDNSKKILENYEKLIEPFFKLILNELITTSIIDLNWDNLFKKYFNLT